MALPITPDPDNEPERKPILASIRRKNGGSLEEASRWYAEFAQREAERLPDNEAEATSAYTGVRNMYSQGTLDTHTRIMARLSAALDRELKRYERLRAMTDAARIEADDDDEDELYGGYDYDNPD